jgi:hypothetical protein
MWTFLPECSLPAHRSARSRTGTQATVLRLDIGNDVPRVPDRTPDMHEMNIEKRRVIHSAETPDRTGDSSRDPNAHGPLQLSGLNLNARCEHAGAASQRLTAPVSGIG